MNSSSDLQPGDLVSVRFAGVLRHYGVVTFGGRILSNNGERGGVISQSYAEFAKGREVKIHPRRSSDDGYHAHHHAFGRLGNDYHLAGSNCVDFVNRATRRSPTVSQYARAGVQTLADMFGPRRKR
ncbi:MAG: hypothetical protein CMK09_05660 [Ponticaulis sp.]|nr:hypothetical protein [Ponticaulis sp.]|tara:strand:+ start:37773 stop:38150 length:378 start_codon:yes stop_codon:yes gene_type:complete